jgi:hypothetical protein
MKVSFKDPELTPLFFNSETWEDVSGYPYVIVRVFIVFPDGTVFAQLVKHDHDYDDFDSVYCYDTDCLAHPLTSDVEDCPWKDIPF